jgi:exodeoxyribonuclease VIII
LKHQLETPSEDTRSLAFGRAFHAAVLEPGVFATKYVPALNADKRTKAYQEFSADVAAKGLSIVDPDEYATIGSMVDAIRSDRYASALLAMPGPCEAAMLWNDPATGILCKGKADKIALDAGIIVDFKTTQDASDDGFAASVDKYGYDLQAYWYTTGAKAATGKDFAFVIVAVEKSGVYGVRTHDMTPWLGYGEAKAKRALDTIAYCRRVNEWPCYTPGIRPLDVPAWIERRNTPYTNPWPSDGDDHPF